MSSRYVNDRIVADERLSVAIQFIAPSMAKGEVLVDAASQIRYESGANTYILSANSATLSGVEWIEPTGGTGGTSIRSAVCGSVNLEDTPATQFFVFNAFQPQTGTTIDYFPVPYNVNIAYIQVYPVESDTWELGATTVISIDFGTVNSAGTFTRFAGGSNPHIQISGPDTTGTVYTLNSDALSFNLTAGDRLASRISGVNKSFAVPPNINVTMWLKGSF